MTNGERVPQALVTRATALAGAGRFDEAIQTTARAVEAFETGGDAAGAERARALIGQFENGEPIRQ